MITKKQADRCATHHYAFKTELILKDVGPIWMPNSVYSAIAVNIGNADIEMLDEMFNKKCPYCKMEVPLICRQCNGTGFIQPYDLAIAFVRGNGKLWHVQLFSNKDDVDCGAIAYTFGGNGSVHKGEFDCRELPFAI